MFINIMTGRKAPTKKEMERSKMEKKKINAKKVVAVASVTALVGANVYLIDTANKQKTSIERLNTTIQNLEKEGAESIKQIKQLKDEISQVTKEKDEVINEFNMLKDITYNETHYNPYNLLEKSGANE